MKLLDLDKTKEYEALRALGRDFIASVKVMVDCARGTDKVYSATNSTYLLPFLIAAIYNRLSLHKLLKRRERI